MTAFFDDPALVAALNQDALEWEGEPEGSDFAHTPFVPYLCRKGKGADCVKYPWALFSARGAAGPITWPSRYWSFCKTPEMRALFYERLDEVCEFVEVPLSEARGGDWLTIQLESFHNAVVLDGRWFTHCLPIGGVQRNEITDPYWHRRIDKVLRLIAPL